jgi:hypothetical protein
MGISAVLRAYCSYGEPIHQPVGSDQPIGLCFGHLVINHVACDHRERSVMRCKFANTSEGMADGVKHS